MSDHLAGRPPELSDAAAMKYEVAVEVLNDLISWHSAAIWREKQQPTPGQSAIDRWSAAMAGYQRQRRALDPADEPAADAVINSCGPIARQLREGAANG